MWDWGFLFECSMPRSSPSSIPTPTRCPEPKCGGMGFAAPGMNQHGGAGVRGLGPGALGTGRQSETSMVEPKELYQGYLLRCAAVHILPLEEIEVACGGHPRSFSQVIYNSSLGHLGFHCHSESGS